MREYDRWQSASDDVSGGGALAPGKRTLTQGLPGRPAAAASDASLRGQERDLTTFDVSLDYREDRATIAAPHRGPLTDRRLELARQRNPHWLRALGFDPRSFSLAAIDSEGFAEDVARHQGEAGLPVDGIVGPKTARRFGAQRSPARSTPDAPDAPGLRGQARDVASFDRSSDYRESRATIDDPYGLHLIDQ